MENGTPPTGDGLNFHRQLDLVDAARLAATPITVIGAGGIGSPTVVCITKMGCGQVTVYDPDTVEDHNLPNQWFRRQDVGKPKVLALQEIVRDFSGVDIVAKPERYTTQPLRGVVIVAVDHMDTRKAIWLQCKDRPRVQLFIEGRMGGEHFHAFAVRPCDPDHIRKYEDELYSHAEATELPCTARAIIYNTMGIGSEIAYLVKCGIMVGIRPDHREPDFHIIRDYPSGVFANGT
ncbi:ThiF family adenylyltransferase [Candidatus Uhrbacteria bacterium]|nr:ThiF family adenylyltransferase [Candidatus Uhrbacteria bacterium]